MPKNAHSRRAGHPPTDIAWRLRHWVWYWLVKEITGQSDEALDATYVPESSVGGTRRRFFQRVRTIGSDPTLPRADLAGRSIFECVHGEGSDPLLQVARDAFDSHLWRMLSDRTLANEDDRRYIADTIAMRGWYRTLPEDREVGLHFIKDEPAFGLSDDREHVYCSMLTHLESNACADSIALLAALFREAVNDVSLQQAMLLQSSLRACTSLWVHDLAIPEDIGRLIERLVDVRLVRNIWMTHEFPRDHASSQRQYVRSLVEAHLADHPAIDGSRRSRDPIVHVSPRMAWLQAHREVLRQEATRIEISIADQHLRRVESSYDGSATDQWMLEHATSMRAALPSKVPTAPGVVKPPERDMRYCLPVYPGRGVRSGNRVTPYLVDGLLDKAMGRRTEDSELPVWRSGDTPPPLDASQWSADCPHISRGIDKPSV